MPRRTREIQFQSRQKAEMGRRLKDAMDRAKIEPAALAEAMGVSTAHISGMTKHGKGSFAAWALACDKARVSLDYVVTGRYPLADADWVREVLIRGLQRDAPPAPPSAPKPKP